MVREDIDCLDSALRAKLDELRRRIGRHQSALVAFSGGVDSTLLLSVAAQELGGRCYALTCVSVTMAQSEQDDARRLGVELGLGERHHIIASHELERPGFAANPQNRCALCKSELMDVALQMRAELGLDAVLLGTNRDDLSDYRPGIAVAAERGASSPLLEADLGKDEIRRLSRALGLRTWDKPQLACLSSRFPHGTEITPERLRRVDRFEDGLRQLGFRQVRVRFHDAVARLEVDDLALALEPAVRARILALGSELGFRHVALDLAGFRSGSLNEPVIPLRRKAG